MIDGSDAHHFFRNMKMAEDILYKRVPILPIFTDFTCVILYSVKTIIIDKNHEILTVFILWRLIQKKIGNAKFVYNLFKFNILLLKTMVGRYVAFK